MSYNVKEFRGEAHRPLRCTDGGQATLQYLAQTLPATFAERNVPAKIRTDTAKSGGLFGSQVPMLVISHPNPPSHYFDIGIVINGQVISFPLLGYSTENTQEIKKPTPRASNPFSPAPPTNLPCRRRVSGRLM